MDICSLLIEMLSHWTHESFGQHFLMVPYGPFQRYGGHFELSCEKKAVLGCWGGKYMLLFALWASHNSSYYSFKIFLRFWLVKTTRIIYHIQLLLTKFEKNLGHIEPMTSKVQPAADYWTVERENLGTRFCYFSWAEKQRTKWRLLLQERGHILIG